MNRPDWLTVGYIAGTHGIRGEVRIIPRTDYPEVRFASGAKVYLSIEGQDRMMPLTVEKARPHKQGLLIRFREWTDIDQAESHKGGTLVVNRSEGMVLDEEDAFYLYEIIGCRVRTTEGRKVGVVTDVLQPGANDVWVVKQPNGKELLLPYIDEVVQEVDVSAQCVVIQWMEGLE